jgi:hypothetical protein
MIAPFGADDVAGASYAGKKLRKLRFLMTDNSLRRTERTPALLFPRCAPDSAAHRCGASGLWIVKFSQAFEKVATGDTLR